MTDDLISRQKAINAIYKSFSSIGCENCENGRRRSQFVCGDCRMQYQNWEISKSAIENALINIVEEGE